MIFSIFNIKGFSGRSDGEEFTCNAGDSGSISGLGRPSGGRHGNPLYYSGLEHPHGQRSLVGCSLWGGQELDTTERLGAEQHTGTLSGHKRVESLSVHFKHVTVLFVNYTSTKLIVYLK